VATLSEIELAFGILFNFSWKFLFCVKEMQWTVNYRDYFFNVAILKVVIITFSSILLISVVLYYDRDFAW